MVVPLAMDWQDLLFANWPVDPDVVDAHLPDALDVDTHDGSAWLSVVPFTNAAVRPRGLPAQLGVDLPELNLRTYVTCEGTPSVYFFSLDAEGVLGVLGARLFHHLPYYYARMSHRRSESGASRFESRRLHPGARPVEFAATYEPAGERLDPKSESLGQERREGVRFRVEPLARGLVGGGKVYWPRARMEPTTLEPGHTPLAPAVGHPGVVVR